MASLILHQIIGEKYCNQNNITNPQEFLKGNISPDILPNKEACHYKEYRPYTTYLSAVKDRVNLSAFCQDKDINTDYDLGYFLHLVTDYVFYNRLITNNDRFNDFCSREYSISSTEMYKEYDRIAFLLLSLFPQTDISKLPNNTITTLNEDLTIFNKEELIRFIEICSNFNLNKIYNEILNNDYSSLNSINF